MPMRMRDMLRRAEAAPAWETDSGTAPAWETDSGTAPAWETDSGTAPAWETDSGTAPAWEPQTSPFAKARRALWRGKQGYRSESAGYQPLSIIQGSMGG